MRTFYRFIGLLGIALLACQHGAPADDKPKVFKKKGGMVFQGGSASWDEDEVRGPLVSVSQRSDGSWAGTIRNQIVDVNVYESRAAGAYLVMKWKKEDGARIITAQLAGRIHRFEFHPDRIEVRLPSRSFTLHKHGDGTWGPGGELTLQGTALEAEPPMPQFGIALIATFAAAE